MNHNYTSLTVLLRSLMIQNTCLALARYRLETTSYGLKDFERLAGDVLGILSWENMDLKQCGLITMHVYSVWEHYIAMQSIELGVKVSSPSEISTTLQPNIAPVMSSKN